jgi:long-chain acyl-CoA synthetase
VDRFDAATVVEPDPEANTTDLLVDRVAATPDLALFAVPDGDGWRDVSAAEFRDQVVALAKGLVAAGIQPGDKLGMMCHTRYEWSLVDFAVWFAGAVLVPVYETSSPAQVKWNLSDSGASGLIVENADHFARFEEVRADLPGVRNVWQIDSGDLDKLAASGTVVPDEEIERRRSIARGSDIATLIYTSGSTGRPKGCVLTHSNFVELSRNTAESMKEVLNVEDASTLLFVTMAHVFARLISVLSVHAGVRVGHQADTGRLLPALGSFKPTFLLAVPRVFEKVYNSAEQQAETGGRGRIFRQAVEVAVAHSRALDDGHVALRLKLRFALFDRLVFSRLRKALGGRVVYAISGSAPLGAHLGHFYRSLGIKILEGYGLTETTAPATVNLPDKFKIGTVGPALPGVSIRIADPGTFGGVGGEILIKGINIFAGYWNNPEATAAAFDDGWFKSGDLGLLDSDGFLTITGRTKEIIVTAGGKNVSPAALEDPIRANPLVEQVVVVGDQKPFIAAMVTLDSEMLPVWAANNGLDREITVEDAAKDPAVREEIQKAVDSANTGVSRAESIRKFVILPTEFTEASGHLTPKMSIKRHAILKDFADTIEEMYAPAASSAQASAKH